MAEERYFVRWRGRVTGPYGSDDLSRMVARGELSRLHDVSTDRVNWRRAGALTDIFESAQVKPLAARPADRGAPAGDLAPPVKWELKDTPQEKPAPVEEERVTWHYDGADGVEGPHTTEDMIRLISEGRLSAGDQVHSSREGADWALIRDTPELAGALVTPVEEVEQAHKADAAAVGEDAARGTSGSELSLTAFYFSVFGLVIPLVLSVVAVVLGVVSLRRAKGKKPGMAKAAVILGVVGAALWVAAGYFVIGYVRKLLWGAL